MFDIGDPLLGCVEGGLVIANGSGVVCPHDAEAKQMSDESKSPKCSNFNGLNLFYIFLFFLEHNEH